MVDDILNYENLVYSIIKKYNTYADRDDLYQVGMMGLISAYKNYKEDRQTKFSTYAYTYILGEVLKYLRENNTVKVSKDFYNLNKSIERGREVLRQRLLREPSDLEISLFLEIDEKTIASVKNCCEKVKSLDNINEENDFSLYDSVKVEDKNLRDEVIDLKTELSKLDVNEKEIIYNRYYKDLTQSEISKELGIGQVQVSRKETKILQKLKTRL